VGARAVIVFLEMEQFVKADYFQKNVTTTTDTVGVLINIVGNEGLER